MDTTDIYIYIYISFYARESTFFDWLMVAFVGLVFFFFLLIDSRIMSHLPFACNWQNRFWDSDPVVVHLPSNKGGNSNI